MKIKIRKTKYLFSIDRYPAMFGRRYEDGREEIISRGEVISIRILGIEITIDIFKKVKQ